MATPWTRVQKSTFATSTGTGTVAPTWPGATTAGNCLIALIAVNSPASPPTINAPALRGWIAGPTIAIASNLVAQIFYASAASARSGAETFTLSSGTRDMVGIVIEYSHVGGAGFALDQSQTLDNSTSNSRSTGTTAALAGANDLVLAIIANVNTSTGSSPGGTPAGTLNAVDSATSGNATGGSKITGQVYELLATAGGTSEIHDTGTNGRRNAGVIAAFHALYLSPQAVGMTATPAAARTTSHAIAAGMTATPAAPRSTLKAVPYAATLTTLAPLRTLKAIDAALTGTPVAALVTSKRIAATATLTPVANKTLAKTLAVSYTMLTAWGIGVTHALGKVIAAALTATPALVRRTGKAIDLAVTLTPATNQAAAPKPGTGWGGPWGEIPWGGMVTPGIGGAPLIGRDEFPKELPPFEHRIIGPNGQVDFPGTVDGFAADEDVGFSVLAGTVESERVRDQPDIYTDGAQWIVTDSATGNIVAAGDLYTPAIGGGAAALKADGWAKRLLRKGERLMYAAQGGYGQLFVPKNSEPYGGDGIGFYVQGEDRFQVSADGALRWHINKGTDSWDEGDRQGFVAAFIGLRPGVRRITGHINSTLDGVNFKLRASTADDQVGPLHGFVDLADFTSGGTDADFDVDLPQPGPVLCIEMQRTTTGTTAHDVDVTITGLIQYGIATDVRWSASDVGMDIAGRLGFATRIKESSLSVLPLDSGPDGVYADPLDLACLLSGMFYRVLGIDPASPVLEMRKVGSVRWEILDPEFPVEPQPLPRFDSVLVPYTLSNGVAQGVLEVTADVIGRPMLPISRSYGPVSLPDPLPNEDNARLLGQRLLERVYPPRFGGRATFSRVYGDGGVATAHEVHSQDTIVLPLNGGLALVTKGLHREGGLVTATFDDGALGADRLVARKARQILLKSPK